MATIPVEVKVNDALPRAVLDAIVEASKPPLAKPMRESIHRAADTFDDFQYRHFNRSNKGGGIWAALKPSTVRSKKRRGTFGKGILRDSDKLFNSLKKGNAGNINLDLPDGVQRGTNVPYAKFHQGGTKKMVARPIKIAPDENAKLRIAGNITGGIRDVIAGMTKK